MSKDSDSNLLLRQASSKIDGFGAATMDDGEPKQQSHAPVGYGHDGHDVPARSDIDEILRRKRKAREYKVRNLDERDGYGGSSWLWRALSGAAADTPSL